jgi:hypothetical protein
MEIFVLARQGHACPYTISVTSIGSRRAFETSPKVCMQVTVRVTGKWNKFGTKQAYISY